MKNTKAAEDESLLSNEGCFRILHSTKYTLQPFKITSRILHEKQKILVKGKRIAKLREREDLIAAGISN